MDEDGFTRGLQGSRVLIWGLGLMGGSLAMALQGQCGAVYGIDRDPEVLALALERGVVQRAAASAPEWLAEADVIVLAVPVRAILQILAELPGLHPGSPVVMDLGSTKQAVVSAMQTLPERFDPLGGHPMCGKEKGSLRHAEGGLYWDAPFALVRLARTSPRAAALGQELARAVGARPLWVGAAEHDRAVADISHLPYLLSSALACATPAESAALIGTGFRSTARLAGTPAEMMLDVLATNRDNVRQSLARFRAELDALDELLAQGREDELAARLRSAARHYAELVA